MCKSLGGIFVFITTPYTEPSQKNIRVIMLFEFKLPTQYRNETREKTLVLIC